MPVDLIQPRTLNVNQNDLYDFFTNDTNALNNFAAIGGQLVGLTVLLGGASIAYTAIRGNQISTDLELDSIISDLTRDQTAAQNIVSTLGYSTIISAIYYFFAQLGEPARRRRIDEDDPDLLFQTNFIDRQGFNPLDTVTGFLDGILSYAVVTRTLIFYGIGKWEKKKKFKGAEGLGPSLWEHGMPVRQQVFTRDNMDGSITENYVFAGICLPLGIFYLIMSIMNLLGEFLGSPGRRFIFEMDEVMGGLLGIPHYSKLEFIFLTFTSVGFFLTWVYDPVISFVTVLTILTGTVYMLICVFYAVFARQNKVVFSIPFLVNLALLIWRSVRFLDQTYHVAVGVCGGVGLLLSLLSLLVMRLRAERCQPTIEKFLQIQRFEQNLKSKKEKLVWLKGKDAPEGFEATVASK